MGLKTMSFCNSTMKDSTKTWLQSTMERVIFCLKFQCLISISRKSSTWADQTNNLLFMTNSCLIKSKTTYQTQLRNWTLLKIHQNSLLMEKEMSNQSSVPSCSSFSLPWSLQLSITFWKSTRVDQTTQSVVEDSSIATWMLWTQVTHLANWVRVFTWPRERTSSSQFLSTRRTGTTRTMSPNISDLSESECSNIP